MIIVNRSHFVALACAAFTIFLQPSWSQNYIEQPEWAKFFEAHQATGTLVILDERKGQETALTHDKIRAEKQYSPASTFKIPHLLFALDSEVVKDEFQNFPWDGQERPVAAWNQDQDIRSSMRNSVVWVYEQIAKQIGLKKEETYLKQLRYGNCDVSGEDPFWIEGHLQISAQEQIQFLRKLYHNQLPFKIEHQRLAKDIIIVEATRDWILRAKTGWSGTVGWWVGWVEFSNGPVFFALNIDTPNRLADLPKREAIVRKILSHQGILPETN